MLPHSLAYPLKPVRRTLYVLSSIFIILFSAAGCQASKVDTLRVGTDNTAVSTLIFIAQDQNYFAQNDLTVTLSEYTSGLTAINAIEAGEVDIAVGSEFVVVSKTLAREPVLALGSIDKLMQIYLIARRDRGIASEADLRGKTIGLPLNTVAEFFLGRFLELRGISMDQVTLQNISPPDLVQALVSGQVDAVVAWQPNATILTEQLGDGVLRWPVQSEQAAYAVLVSSSAWVESHRDPIKRFMRALVKAEIFYQQNPDQAKAIVQKRLNYDRAFIDTIWPEHQFQLVLEQSMILAMEDEARWLISRGLTPATQTPEFISYLYIDGIQSVKPEAVNIIR